MLDISNSLGTDHMKDAIVFLKDLVNDTELGSKGTHFGLITFNKNARLEFNFGDASYYKKNAVFKKLDDVRSVHSRKETKEQDDSKSSQPQLALEKADQLFTVQEGDRPEKPNVLIVLTDAQVIPSLRDAVKKSEFNRFVKSVAANLKVSDSAVR